MSAGGWPLPLITKRLLVAMAEDFAAKADLIDQAEQNQRSNGRTPGETIT